MNPEIVQARSAIESLRSGVPSRSAVVQLGTTQNDVRESFEASLEALAEGRAASPLLLSATFGAGKTHLLNYLQSLAEQEGFVTSFVIVSPEMPLGNAHLVVKGLAEVAHAPGQTGKAVRALSTKLNVRSEAYQELEEWARNATIDDRFRALLRLYAEFGADEEFRAQILSDFEGRPLLKTILKRKLKEVNAAAAYDLSGGRAALTAHDRVRLMAQYFRACGCKGWVIFFDEMERVAKFSLKQRLVAYEELGWWKRIAEQAGCALLPVFTTASGFVAESVTGGAQDELRISSSGQSEEERLAREGIEFLKTPMRLDLPTSEQELQIAYRLKNIYETAYGVSVPTPQERRDVHTSIRSEIRRWITLWDLQRYYPAYNAQVEVSDVTFDTESIADSALAEETDAGE